MSAVAGLTDVPPTWFSRYVVDEYFTIDANWIVLALLGVVPIAGRSSSPAPASDISSSSYGKPDSKSPPPISTTVVDRVRTYRYCRWADLPAALALGWVVVATTVNSAFSLNGCAIARHPGWAESLRRRRKSRAFGGVDF
jgi:hypothetical protein